MTLTHFKKMKNPNYVGSWDLMDDSGNYHNRIVTITKVEKQLVHDGTGKSEMLPVAILKECKPFILNATNMKTIARIFDTPFIENWVNKKIELTVKKIKVGKDFTDAIRVVESAPKAPQLQELTEGSENWDKVVTALKGGFKIEQVKQKYSITPENEAKLKEVCNV